MGKLMSIVGVPITLGPILGPVIGGFLVEYLSWRWIFFVNIPIGIIALYLIHKKLPNFAAANKQVKLDWFGILLLGTLSASFIYGITKAASSSNFNNLKTIEFMAIGILLTIIYVIYAMKYSKKVIMPLNLFHHKNFTASIYFLFQYFNRKNEYPRSYQLHLDSLSPLFHNKILHPHIVLLICFLTHIDIEAYLVRRYYE